MQAPRCRTRVRGLEGEREDAAACDSSSASVRVWLEGWDTAAQRPREEGQHAGTEHPHLLSSKTVLMLFEDTGHSVPSLAPKHVRHRASRSPQRRLPTSHPRPRVRNGGRQRSDLLSRWRACVRGESTCAASPRRATRSIRRLLIEWGVRSVEGARLVRESLPTSPPPTAAGANVRTSVDSACGLGERHWHTAERTSRRRAGALR
ncbi:hypothetical protein B0H10DRAFT_1414043 [Mycena sp. CBHHK59/15]|nr:hypothetical protein B0H10DRAFT_1414043 [Mycena sp. CBHHK59/15]